MRKILLLVLLLLLTACNVPAAQAPTATQSSIPNPQSSITLTPSVTVQPSYTPRPTKTPEPTPTAIPPRRSQ